MFTRRNVPLPQPSVKSPRSLTPDPHPVSEREYRVLVINSSQEMAKEITLQLTLSIPGCSIMYAPSLELARLILSRRSIDLVVSSAVLPDGGLLRLKSILQARETPPDVAIVGDASAAQLEAFKSGGYEVSHVRRLQSKDEARGDRVLSLRGKSLRLSAPILKSNTDDTDSQISTEAISSLGADLRNDLNNPLQEIVAMLFVAKAGGTNSGGPTAQALDAIDRAAKNMATVVKSLEDKIRRVVQPA
jgi:signal transduction histidine kinase